MEVNKRRRVDAAVVDSVAADDKKVLCQLKDEQGTATGPVLELPINVTPKQLQLITRKLVSEKEEEDAVYSFYVDDKEIGGSLAQFLEDNAVLTEEVVRIVYRPQALFRVRAVTRCSATVSGHTDNIVELYFSPDGRRLATGSGDCTVRFWDVWTQTPEFTCKGHEHWVQCIAWAPDGKTLVSGGRDKQIRVWDPETGKEIGSPLSGHKQFITWISWEPLHSSPSEKSTRFATASKDGTARVWDLSKTGRKIVFTVTQHSKSVTCVKWGGEGLLYTSSQDTTIKVWRVKDGALVRTLTGHAHWVNSLSLSTDYAIRTGPFDEHGNKPEGSARDAAKARYEKLKAKQPERLVSCSEDHTMYLWEPTLKKKPICERLTGHQKGINYVAYSPDGRLFASASFDKSCKIWNGVTGKFVGTLRGHVGPVYRITWAGDSRLLVTGSEDSTLKLWNVKTCRLMQDLPGHAGSVYAVDWSPNGQLVASGGADKTLKIWRQ